MVFSGVRRGLCVKIFCPFGASLEVGLGQVRFPSIMRVLMVFDLNFDGHVVSVGVKYKNTLFSRISRGV